MIRGLGAAAAISLVLAGNGLMGLHFGVSEKTAIQRVGAIARVAPTLSDSARVDCGVDLADWPGLTLDLVKGRLAGYTYSATGHTKLSGLATAQGLKVGQSTATAHRLYGSKLTTSWAQDGSYALTTPQGAIAGYLKATSAPGTTDSPAGRLVTIGAGDEGCPAASP